MPTESGKLVFAVAAVGVLLVTFNGIRPVPGATLSDLVLAVSLSGALIFLTSRWFLDRVVPLWMFAAAGLILSSALLVAIFPAKPSEVALLLPGITDPSVGSLSNIGGALRLAGALIAVPLLVVLVANSARRIRLLTDVWIAGVAVGGFLGALGYLGVGGVAHLVSESGGSPGTGVAREVGLTTHSNAFALASAMSLPVAVMRLSQVRGLVRACFSVAVVVLFIAIALSGSRAGLVAALLGLLLLGCLHWQGRQGFGRAGVMAVVLLVIAGVAISISPPPAVERLLGIDQTAAVSNASRAVLYHAVGHEILQRPVAGHGFQYIRGSHDIYLQLMHAGGIAALAGFLVFGIGSITTAFRIGRRGDVGEHLQGLSQALVASMAVWLLAGLVGNWLFDRYLYVPAGLILSIWALCVSSRSKRPNGVSYFSGAVGERPFPTGGRMPPYLGSGRPVRRPLRPRVGWGHFSPFPVGFTGFVRHFRPQHIPSRALVSTLAGGIGSQLTLVATGVILARALGPVDRGHLALLIIISSIAGSLGSLGISYALTYSIARVPGRAVEIMDGVSRRILIRVGVATVVSGILLAILTANEPRQVRTGALIVTIALAPAIIQQCGLGVLQGLQRFGAFNVLRVAPNATFGVVGVILLLVDHAGFIELTLAWGISRTIFVPLTMRQARREAEIRHDDRSPNPPEPSWIVRFGRRSLIGASPPIETYRLDQSVVGLFLSPAALGIYVVALAFTNLPRFIAQSVGLVANPFVAASTTHTQARRRMWLFAWAAIPLFIPVIAAIWFVVPVFTTFFFGSSFAGAAPVTRLLLIATLLYCARRVLTDAARGAGYPTVGSVAELIASVAAVPLFAFFVPMSGLKGVAYALIGSSMVAMSVLVGTLIHQSLRGEVPNEWFQTITAEDELSTAPADG